MAYNEAEFVTRLHNIALKDPDYNELLEDLRQLEPEFVRIRRSLPPEQQELLDMYISACENLKYSLAFIAYKMVRIEYP